MPRKYFKISSNMKQGVSDCGTNWFNFPIIYTLMEQQ